MAAGTSADTSMVPGLSTSPDVAGGLLIYPANEVLIRDQVRIRNTSVSVGQKTIDFGGCGKLLYRACDRLADEVFIRRESHG